MNDNEDKMNDNEDKMNDNATPRSQLFHRSCSNKHTYAKNILPITITPIKNNKIVIILIIIIIRTMRRTLLVITMIR